jgi:hypothetical protein
MPGRKKRTIPLKVFLIALTFELPATIRRSLADNLIPCSPNKLLFSRIRTVTPGERFLPRELAQVMAAESRLDGWVPPAFGAASGGPCAYENLEFDDGEEDERRAHITIPEHLSSESVNAKEHGKVWLVTSVDDRRLRRIREDGRYQSAPDTKQQRDIASKLARDVPILILLRQEGAEERGWRGLPFWWPVIMTPFSAVTSVFADEVPADAGSPTS